jgi:hypothetical protein
MNLCKVWIEQCEAARRIEDEFGTPNALTYLVGEKFLNFLEAAESDASFRAEIPSFVAEVKTIFELWQLAEYLETARQTEPFDPDDYEDEESDLALAIADKCLTRPDPMVSGRSRGGYP